MNFPDIRPASILRTGILNTEIIYPVGVPVGELVLFFRSDNAAQNAVDKARGLHKLVLFGEVNALVYGGAFGHLVHKQNLKQPEAENHLCFRFYFP